MRAFQACLDCLQFTLVWRRVVTGEGGTTIMPNQSRLRVLSRSRYLSVRRGLD